jgi:hypothetical protein
VLLAAVNLQLGAVGYTMAEPCRFLELQMHSTINPRRFNPRFSMIAARS